MVAFSRQYAVEGGIMVDPSRIQITGPLKSYVEHVWSELLAQGYTALSSRLLLNLMAHLSRWLEGIGLQARELTNKGIEDFLEKRREAGYTKHLSRRAVQRQPSFPLPLPHQGMLPAPGAQCSLAARIRRDGGS